MLNMCLNFKEKDKTCHIYQQILLNFDSLAANLDHEQKVTGNNFLFLERASNMF